MDKQSQIIQAAVNEFSRLGYSKTTIQDIATAAQIGKGTVYGYFKSKPDILLAACDCHMQKCVLEVSELLANPQLDAIQLIEEFLRYFLFSIVPNQSSECFLFYELLVLAASDKDYEKQVYEMLQRRTENLEMLFVQIYEIGVKNLKFKELEYPLEYFRFFLAAIDGLVFQYSFRGEKMDLQKLFESELLTFQKLLFVKEIK